MKLLHTSDWHVGKAHARRAAGPTSTAAVLAEIVGVAARRAVDLVVVAGDLFDTAAPSPEAEGIVYDALLRLAAPGRRGRRHRRQPRQRPARSRVLAPLFDRGGVTSPASRAGPTTAACSRFVAGDGGAGQRRPAAVRVASAASSRAEQLMSTAGVRAGPGATRERMRPADRGAVRAVRRRRGQRRSSPTRSSHGGATGGGERAAHLVEEYAVLAPVVPGDGRLRRARPPAPRPADRRRHAPIHYPGSPLQLDFGETSEPKQVNVVELEPGLPARVTPVELRSRPAAAHVHRHARAARRGGGRRRRLAAAGRARAAPRRARPRGPRALRRPGGRRAHRGAAWRRRPTVAPRRGRTPHELFAEYLATRASTIPGSPPCSPSCSTS